MKVIKRKIPARVSVIYQCTKCKTRYRSIARARECEALPIEPRLFSVGDCVRWRERHHCSRCKKNHFPNGKIVKIFGPLIADEEYNLKWLQNRLGQTHSYQYEVKWQCPKCKDRKSNLFYSPELKKVKNKTRG